MCQCARERARKGETERETEREKERGEREGEIEKEIEREIGRLREWDRGIQRQQLSNFQQDYKMLKTKMTG